MAIITRRTAMGAVIASGAALAAPALIRPARAADFTYKFGHGFPLTHPFHVFVQQAANQILKDSGGRVEVQVFGNNVLGGDTQMLSQVRANAIQFFEGGGVILSILVPEAALSGMPFAFHDYPAVWRALDGDVGAYIRAGFEKLNLYAFEKMWDNGFRQISTSTHPIASPTDLSGFKIRVPPGQLYTSTFRMLGAAPTNINLAETYSALQTGLVSGQENPLVVVDSGKFFEVQKYISMTSHIWDGTWLFANGAAWKALPPDLQKVVANGFNNAAEGQRAETAKQNADLVATLGTRGMKFNTPDIAPFRSKLQAAGFYKEWSGKFAGGGWSALQKYVGDLA
jgi:tripartite ATP-independent transporter DctP family solute receptor